MAVYSIILAGGYGTRLWPISSAAYPKQFMRLDNEDTMLQKTFKRNNLTENKSTYFIINPEYNCLINEQILEIKAQNYNLIVEPEAKNTAPSILAAALHIYRDDPEAIIIVTPSDHEIKDIEYYQTKIREAIKLANTGNHVTFGIIPNKAETEFGYIKQGKEIKHDVFAIDKFMEKPSFEQVCEYLKDNKYYWNSGIFIFSVKMLLSELSVFEPDMVQQIKLSLEGAILKDLCIFLAPEPFSYIKANSIDYALMERTTKAVFMRYESFWSDMGSWHCIWNACDKDANGNVIGTNTITYNTKNSLVISQSDKKVATLGLENISIIGTPDSVLVASTKESHKIKDMIAKVKGNILSSHDLKQAYTTYKPWGRFENIIKEKYYVIKKIIINPGQKLSLQYHQYQNEYWVIIKGSAEALVGNRKSILKENDYIFIPKLTKHRLANIGMVNLELIEIQFGDVVEESDIIRI